MAIPIRQASINGGELAPGLWARTNLKRFSDYVRLCRNIIPLQEGKGANRSGTIFKSAASDAATGAATLIPFRFGSGSLARNFQLEFHHLGVRIYKDGALVKTLATPYAQDALYRLKWAQAGAVMTLGGSRLQLRELKWDGPTDADWSISIFSTARPLTPPTGLAFLAGPYPTNTVATAREWQWKVTAVDADKRETLPSDPLAGTSVISTDKTVKIQWTAVPGATEYNVYRGRNGKFGWIGTSTTTAFYDDGNGPVYAESPPSGRSPITTDDTAPNVIAYHEQRLVGGNSYLLPNGIEASRTADLHNFDRASPPRDEDAVTWNVLAQEYEEIRSFVSIKRFLLALTNNRIWSFAGSEGPIMPDDVLPEMLSRWGASWLDPLVIGDALIYAQDVGATIREFAFDGGGNDLTLTAQHFFQGHSIVSWCYAHEPHRCIWAVRDDGLLLSCTYVRQLETWAWARHDTGDGDLFESVCSVTEAKGDAVYALVKRWVGGAWVRGLEKLAPRVNLTRASGVFLDASVTKNNVQIVNGLGHLEGRTVYALADGAPRGPFVVVGGQVDLGAVAAVATVGLRITADLGSLDVYSTQEEIRQKAKNVKRVYMEIEESGAFRAGQKLTDNLMLVSTPDGDALPADALYTGLVQVNIESEWEDGGAVVLRHVDPLPLNILSFTREVEFGGP